MRSIARQLSLGLIGSLLLVGLLIGQVGLWLFDSAARDAAARELAQAAERLLAAIERGADGPQLSQPRLDAAYRRPLSGEYFVMRVGDQTWRSRSLWDADLPLPAATGLAPQLLPGPSGQQLLLWRADYRRYGHDIAVVVAADYTPTATAFRRIIHSLLALWAGALVLLLLWQRWWVARALRPLEQARRQIVQLQAGERSRLDESAPEELRPLIVEINHLLDYTERALLRSRRALGNLGHALKTPLAVLGHLAERDTVRANTGLHGQFTTQLHAMRNRIGRELSRARAAGEALPNHRFDLAAELPLLLQGVQLAHRTELEMSSDIGITGTLPFDREDMLELLGNLLDNAARFARQRLHLQVARQDDRLMMAVEDDGPGIEPSARSQALQRGVRLDEEEGGHGLGLAIVGDIAALYGGELTLERAGLGGLRAVITLPWPHRSPGFVSQPEEKPASTL